MAPSNSLEQQTAHYRAGAETTDANENQAYPLGGIRYSRSALEWHASISTVLFPDLADHRIGETIIFPGAGFLEIALSMACVSVRSDAAGIEDIELLKPLILTNGSTHEIMSRVSQHTNVIEISSRPWQSNQNWLTHYRGRIVEVETRAVMPNVPHQQLLRLSHNEIYQLASASSLHYGPAFRLLKAATVYEGRFIAIDLANVSGKVDFVLDPMRVDACFHGLLAIYPELRAIERRVNYLPIRIEQAALFLAGRTLQTALIEVVQKDKRSIIANLRFFASDGQLVGLLRGVHFRRYKCGEEMFSRPTRSP